MSGPTTARVALQRSRIATGSEDESGVIVRVDDRIVAILVRLDANCHEEARGSWHLEAGFGSCAGAPQPFARLSDGLAWIAGRLGIDVGTCVELMADADRIGDAVAAVAAAGPPNDLVADPAGAQVRLSTVDDLSGRAFEQR